MFHLDWSDSTCSLDLGWWWKSKSRNETTRAHRQIKAAKGKKGKGKRKGQGINKGKEKGAIEKRQKGDKWNDSWIMVWLFAMLWKSNVPQVLQFSNAKAGACQVIYNIFSLFLWIQLYSMHNFCKAENANFVLQSKPFYIATVFQNLKKDFKFR